MISSPEVIDDGRIAALDGLRGLAVTMVVLFHAPTWGPALPPGSVPAWPAFGWSGVDLFFVLSGFVITRLLLETKGTDGYLKNFYARRTLRIFPLFYGYLLLYVLLREPLENTWFQVLHVSNWYVVGLGHWGSSTPNALTWSLAIEEQYYLLWAPTVLFLSERRLALVCGVTFIAAFGLRQYLAETGGTLMWMYAATPSRLDTLALGSLVAISMRSETSRQVLQRFAPMVFGVGAAATLSIVLVQRTPAFWRMEPAQLALLLTCIAVTYAALVAMLATGAPPWLSRVFEGRALRSLGRHSYAMYLLHVEVARGLTALVQKAGGAASFGLGPRAVWAAFSVACVIASWSLSVVVWHLLEKHFLKLKRHFERPRVAPVVTQ